jgi:hypothetical protein
MTWLYDENNQLKQLDTFDIIINPNDENKLKKDSLLKIRHLKSISKKRILWRIWRLENLDIEWIMLYDEIDRKIKKMMWIK